VTDLSEQDYRMIGAKHEAARIIVWVRMEIGRLRETIRLTPARHVRRHKQLQAVLAPLLRLDGYIEKEWGFVPRAPVLPKDLENGG
jgi:hypothetical protein